MPYNIAAKHKFVTLLSVMGAVLLFVAGCSEQGEKPYPVATTEVGPYPVSTTEITDVQVVPVPQNSPLPPYAFATSDAGFATLHGRLVVLDPLSILPAPGDSVYLVPLDADAPLVTIPPFDPSAVPQAEVDERTGAFVFTNIEPGRYAVVVITMGGNQMPTHRMDDNNLAIIDVVDADRDRTVELGDISLP